jgi:capsular exopolysaccharide synthesis family protein
MNSLATSAQSNVYLQALKRWWWLPVLFALLSASLAFAGTKILLKPQYGANTTIQVQQLTTVTALQLPTDANAVSTLMTSKQVLDYAYKFIDRARAVTHIRSLLAGYNQIPLKHKHARSLAWAVLVGKAGESGIGVSGNQTLFDKVGVSPESWALEQTAAGLPDAHSLYKNTACLADTTDKFVTCTATSKFVNTPPAILTSLNYAFIRWNTNRTKLAFKQEVDRYTKQLNRLNGELFKAQNNKNQNANTQYLISSLENTIGTLTGQQLALETQIAQLSANLSVVTQPVASNVPVSPHPFRNSALGLVVGLGIAAALIVLLEYLDDSFRSSEEITEATGLPLLGSVRRFEGPSDELGLTAVKMPRSAMAEAYRVARANIQFTNVSGNLSIILVTSARDGEGKTTTASNLATAFALAGKRVLLVDADLRRPGLTRMVRMKDLPGLTTVLIDPGTNVIRPSEVDGLDIVPSGAVPPNPAELLGSDRMRQWIEDRATEYDIILLDTPPVLSVADTRILATLADATVMVVDPSLTSRRMVKQARKALEGVGSRVLGLILNRDVMRGEGYYYNYYYYDRAGSKDDQAPAKSR